MTTKQIFVVEWDTTTDEYPNGDPDAANLPAYVAVPGDVEPEDVADWLSDEYGWLVRSVAPTTGKATIYYAMPTRPYEASAAGLREYVEMLKGDAKNCTALEEYGWVSRWCYDNDPEFFEFAYEKRFLSEDDVWAEIERLELGLEPIWDED